MTGFFVGLDLGQSSDYTAIVVAKRFEQWLPAHDEKGRQKSISLYRLVHIQRLPLQTPYPKQVHTVRTLLSQPPLLGNVVLSLDYTGVGRPVFDMFVEKISCPLLGITIHGGDHVNKEGHQRARVPKRDLVSVVQVLLQSARLKIAGSLPEARILVQELLNFRVKIDPHTSHDSYSAWRESQHDDLVLACALSLWTAEKCQPLAGGVKILKGY